MKLNEQEFMQWVKQKAPWRTIGILGEELVISHLEDAGYIVVKQKPYYIQTREGQIDLGSKVDILALDSNDVVHVFEVKSTSKGWKPRLSKAQQNLQAYCAKKSIPYLIVQVMFEADGVTIEDLYIQKGE